MRKVLFRLVAIPVIAFACSLSAGSVQNSYAAQGCFVKHFGCQVGIDCCCGFFAMCVDSQAQCNAYCGGD